MKSIVSILFTLVVCSFAIVSCSSNSSTSAHKADSTSTTSTVTASVPTLVDTPKVSKEILVGDANYNKIVSFIQKNGFIHKNGYDLDNVYYQYNFTDSKGNLHGFTLVKTDADGKPVDLRRGIFVYAFKQGVRDQEHFIGYDITPEKISNIGNQPEDQWQEYASIQLGYTEFLQKVLGS